MKFLDEYRDADAAKTLLDTIASATKSPCRLMEICGGQTHSIIKYGIDQLLPDSIELIHGPGCPVCVTPQSYIDHAIELASRPETILTSFGDMVRVPGTRGDLLSAKSNGADVRIVYSPLDALALARSNPDRQVIFFGVGFETTAPTTAMALYQAKQEAVPNFSVLVSNMCVPPAMHALLSAPENEIDGFLAAGHVCTIMGVEAYHPIAEHYQVPIVVTGFEPVDILQGILLLVQQLAEGRTEVENQYSRTVRSQGNVHAQRILDDVYQAVDREWRGLGVIPKSGLGLRDEYRDFDALFRFAIDTTVDSDAADECISGLILQGTKKPHECPAFGTTCIPENPIGAPMVSSEGACAAYYRYRRHDWVGA